MLPHAHLWEHFESDETERLFRIVLNTGQRPLVVWTSLVKDGRPILQVQPNVEHLGFPGVVVVCGNTTVLRIADLAYRLHELVETVDPDVIHLVD